MANDTILIKGEIGGWWRDVDSDMLLDKMKKAAVKTLHIGICSFGGSAYDGIEMADFIKAFPGEVIIYAFGKVMSAATLPFAAADKSYVVKNSTIGMIHKAGNGSWGNADDKRKEASHLDKIDQNIAGIYLTKMQKNGKKTTFDEIIQMMAEEKFFSPQEMVDYGLADGIVDSLPARFVTADANADDGFQIPEGAVIPKEYATFFETKNNKAANDNVLENTTDIDTIVSELTAEFKPTKLGGRSFDDAIKATLEAYKPTLTQNKTMAQTTLTTEEKQILAALKGTNLSQLNNILQALDAVDISQIVAISQNKDLQNYQPVDTKAFATKENLQQAVQSLKIEKEALQANLTKLQQSHDALIGQIANGLSADGANIVPNSTGEKVQLRNVSDDNNLSIEDRIYQNMINMGK
ncbi:MAG: ATP-dependent Clp protease proteolytic subunit [Chitinophagales bacterium]